ncbi:MAG: hypothetical protein GXO48_06265 [Chlorobi bacterium]|nr:hypothetical protein [Chlorobiota bacterium]
MKLAILLIGVLILLGHILEEFYKKTQIPDVLWLTTLGLILGPAFGLVSPDDFGKVGLIFSKVALIIILFEGGLDMHIKEMTRPLRIATILAITGFVSFAITAALIGYFLLGLGPLQAIILGSILGATSAIVVVPMLKGLNVSKNVQDILFLESSLSDVLGIVVTLALLEAYMLGGNVSVFKVIGAILTSFIMASIIGVLGGFVWSYLAARIETLRQTTLNTLAVLFVLYGISEMLEYSGAISALAFGLFLGNAKYMSFNFLKRYLQFVPEGVTEKEQYVLREVVFFVKVFFFVYLGISMQLTDLRAVLVGITIIIAFLVVRAIMVRNIIGRKFSLREATVMSIMIPRGLVPAVLASLVVELGVEQGYIIREVSYAVILFSILATAILVLAMENTRIARLFGLLYRESPHKPEQ